MKVFIGYDESEPEALEVARSSLLCRASGPLDITPLDLRRLAACGLLRRPTDRRGQRYDILSNAPASTDFAISRFLVPILAQSGWAAFLDGDVIALDDISKMFALADERYAVMCVKHTQQGAEATKMDGQAQTRYPRKNWSSVMLFNCDHPGNRRLSLNDVQERRGFDLHQFYWLADSEIGELPQRWNWLVGIESEPTDPAIAHFTLGGPFTPGWRGGDYDHLWHKERQTWQRQNSAAARASHR